MLKIYVDNSAQICNKIKISSALEYLWRLPECMKKYRVSEGQMVLSPTDQMDIYMSRQHGARHKPLRDSKVFLVYRSTL